MTPAMRTCLFCICIAACVLSPLSVTADALSSVHLRQVHVEGQIGRRIESTIRNNLLLLNVEKDFLAPFQTKEEVGGYIGLGKLIEMVVRLSAHRQTQDLVSMKRKLVASAIGCQTPDGYLGCLKPEFRMWGLWDISELSYLVQGLVMDYRLFVEKPSLDAAKRIADYIMKRWSAEPSKIPGGGHLTTHMAVVGLEPSLLALHEATGDRRYLDFCVRFRDLPGWKPGITLGRWGRIEGHVYSYLSMCVAQLRLCRLQPDPRLLEATWQALDFLSNHNGLAITGACGDHECWHDTQEGTMNLGETCATAYWIRLLDELLRMDGKSRWGDFMERTIYNALFGAQSPDGRRLRYYTPFDGPRAYFQEDTYCCPSNYRRIISELPGMIYYRWKRGLAVNLYTTSTVELELQGRTSLSVRQETEYPDSGKVIVTVDPSRPVKFTLRLRIPGWCKKPKASLNGRPLENSIECGMWLDIEREWKAGDAVQLELPMNWRFVKGRKSQAGRVAVMRGPVVFCLNRSINEGLQGADLRLIVIDPASLTAAKRNGERPYGSVAARIRAWGPGAWYPRVTPELHLLLTPFPDPDGEAVYFKVPNPSEPFLVDDELIGRVRPRGKK